MTRTSFVLLTGYGLVFVLLVSLAGSALTSRDWADAAALYGIAVIPVAAAIREVKLTTVIAPQRVKSRPALLTRIKISRHARSLTRGTGRECDLWWTSQGADHDAWCRNFDPWRDQP